MLNSEMDYRVRHSTQIWRRQLAAIYDARLRLLEKRITENRKCIFDLEQQVKIVCRGVVILVDRLADINTAVTLEGK